MSRNSLRRRSPTSTHAKCTVSSTSTCARMSVTPHSMLCEISFRPRSYRSSRLFANPLFAFAVTLMASEKWLRVGDDPSTGRIGVVCQPRGTTLRQAGTRSDITYPVTSSSHWSSKKHLSRCMCACTSLWGQAAH